MNTDDPISAAVGLVCQNQAWIVTIIGFLGAHLGFSVVSAVLKKLGISDGVLVQLIRLMAVDVHPTDTTVLQNAATVAVKQNLPVSQAVAQAVAAKP